MKYLVFCGLLLYLSAVHAETDSSTVSAAGAPVSNTASVKKATEAVAKRLIDILELTTVSKLDRATINLKGVVIKALSEGQQMSDIRRAAHQAAKEVMDKALLVPTIPGSPSVPDSAAAQAVVIEPQGAAVVANPMEVSRDPETGDMTAVVLSGESIFRLAQRVYGKENGRMYLDIHAANRDKIKDINVVVEGMVLTMP